MFNKQKKQRKDSEVRSAFHNYYNNKPVLFMKSILIGLITGSITVAFRTILNRMMLWRYDVLGALKHSGAISYILWVLGLTGLGLLIGLAVQRYPLIRGSGIPQVKGVMSRQLDNKWFPEILLKFFGGVVALGFGMSLGREGPSVQLGSFVSEGILSFSKRPNQERKFLIVSGAAAGLAAAFNAPLAGIMFVLEELHRAFSPVTLICAMGASVSADLVAGRFFGLKPIFDFHSLEILSLGYLPYILILGVIIAFSGDIFKRLLYLCQDIYVKLKMPHFVRPVPPLLLSFFLGLKFFDITGGGHEMIESLVLDLSAPLHVLLLLLVMKMLLTTICYGSGTPGGIFLPLLLMGALIGHIFGKVLFNFGIIESSQILNFMILGMAAQFTSIVKAPVTGSILILEMCGNLNHLSGLVGICVVSYMVSDLMKSQPVYDVLLERLLTRNPNLQKNTQKIIIDIPVCTNSILSNKKIREVEWPEGTLVVGIRRGETDQIPKGDTEILPGDLLLILVTESRAQEVNAPLIRMGMESS